MKCLLPYLSMVTVPHIMVGLERMLDYRGVGLERFHCSEDCVLECLLLVSTPFDLYCVIDLYRIYVRTQSVSPP